MAIQSDNQPEVTTLEKWEGLNQQSKRGSINDEEEWWNENLFAIGPGNLRANWGLSAPVYTAPAGTTILRIFFGFYGNQTPYYGAPGPGTPGAMGWMFLSDGSIDEVDLNTMQTTGLRAASLAWAPPGLPNQTGQIWTPIAPQYWASAKVWRPQFQGAAPPNPSGSPGGVLFGSPYGLFAWDGTTISGPGDPAPDWLTDLQETNPGATIPNMPSGLPAIYAMEVYESRLWVFGKDVFSFSAPSNGADFTTANGGGSVGYFGDKLVYSYMDAHASAGYLYVFGDSSTDLIANVQLTASSGTTPTTYTTNFSYQNIDPQIGQRFPRPVGVLGRYMVMFNMAGVFLMQGGDAQPIGDKAIGVYNTLDTSLYLPTMAAATIHGFRVLLINGRFTDPWGVTRNLILMYHPTKGHEFWSVASQGVELTNIGSYEQDSVIRPYGTDGTTLWRLFAQPDPALQKRLSTKSLRGEGLAQLTIKNFKRLYAEVDDNDGRGVSITGTVTTAGGGVPGGTQAVDFELEPGGIHAIIPAPLAGAGIEAAIDLVSTSPDFTIQRLHLAADERTLFGA